MFAFDTDHDLITPAGGALLAEIGLDAGAVRDALSDDRAIRCPERPAADPAHGFARLVPDRAPGEPGEASPLPSAD